MEKNISQPFDQEMEEAVLRTLLLEKKAMANAMPILRAEMFCVLLAQQEYDED